MNHISTVRVVINYGYAYPCVAVFLLCEKLSKTKNKIGTNRILTALLPFLATTEFFHSKIKCLKSKNSKNNSRQLF